MVSGLSELSEKRKRWVEANRENGFEEGIKHLLTNLYPDNAHFIYELLQNAEDAKATEVQFKLADDFIEFTHNGARLFSLEDIDAITSIGVSTKKDDPTNIGKFGVGFKAVFAYSATPEIISGGYHFHIRDMVVPDTEGLSARTITEKFTHFSFPFDNPEKPPERARAEIEKNLKQLDENTLLFLTNIRKIEYIFPDSTLGFLELVEKGEHRVEISVQHPKDSSPSSEVFLRFDKWVEVIDEDKKPKNCRIAIAFAMQKDSKPSHTGEIKPLNPGKVSIYFPAEKETSNLHFHIHAPFASTVSRDSVRDCSANNELRDHLADLISDSMAVIRDLGLLTVEFLGVLPNKKDNLSSFYRPILQRLIKTFREENLIPMKQGYHARAERVYRGTAQLSHLVSDEDLAFILDVDREYRGALWISNPQQKNQREDNFLETVEIREWTFPDLINAFKLQQKKMEIWMKKKSFEWHQELYAALSDHPSGRNPFRDLEIVRITDGSYGFGKNTFFPKDEVTHDAEFPRVAKEVYTSGKNEQQQKKAKEFLASAGVREVGEKEEMEALLNSRYADPATLDPKLDDLRRFINFSENNTTEIGIFSDSYIFKLSDGKWRKPAATFLDSPFMDTGLSVYYEALGEKRASWGLSEDYLKIGIAIDKLVAFAKLVGVRSCTQIVEKESYGERDYLIDIGNSVLELKNLSLSKLIWEMLISEEKEIKRVGILKYLHTQRKSRVNFYNSGESYVIRALKEVEWVPQKTDPLSFVKPSEANSKLLPEGFSLDNGWEWLDAVEFEKSIRDRREKARTKAQERTLEHQVMQKAANDIGFESLEEAKEIADLKKQDPEGFKKWLKKIKEKSSFPQRRITNPDRRREKLDEQLEDADEKSYTIRERSVRGSRNSIDPKTLLRALYTNEEDEMVCQICKEEMPFKKRDGEYYFEAVEAFQEDFPKEHEAQFLALCPVCAAMYKEFVKSEDSKMRTLKDELVSTDDLELPVVLGEIETSIRFVETHRQDMKEILKYSSEMLSSK